MLHHEWAGTNKAAKARSARLARPVPALSSLLLPFPPLPGGDITLTEKTTKARRSKLWRCFNQPVATGINSLGFGGHKPQNSKKIRVGNFL